MHVSQNPMVPQEGSQNPGAVNIIIFSRFAPKTWSEFDRERDSKYRQSRFCFEWHHNDMAQEVETGECRIFNQWGIIRASISCKITLSVKRTHHFQWPNEFHTAEPFAFSHNAFRKVHFESDLATFIHQWSLIFQTYW